MRVLVIHTCYQHKGGEDMVVDNEVKLLRDNGVEVELLLFSNSSNTLSKLLQLPFRWSSYRHTQARIKAFKPDVIHIHNLHYAGSPSVIYAAKRLKVPVVVTLHNYRLLCPSATLFHRGKPFTDSLNSQFPVKAVLKGVYRNSRILTAWISISMVFHRWLGTWGMPDRYISLSAYTKELFLASHYRHIADKLIVKPNFCYDSPLTVHIYKHFYLYVGRLSEEKGINVLLNAFAGSAYTLKIVGDGPLKEEVQAYAARCPNIQYQGLLDRGQIDQLMHTATALIFPSLWYETFGMVVIEAFATGTPVIASALGPIKYLVEDGVDGLQFIPGDAQDLRQKINYYGALSADQQKMYRQRARQKYEQRFSPSINAQQLISIYEGIVNRQ